MKKYFLFGYIFPLFLIFFTSITCNNISDELIQTQSIFHPNENINTVKDDTLFLFNSQLGYIVDFKGTHSCTVRVNGEIISAIDNDSLYSRFITHNKGIISINDSLYGRMEFSEQEINDWQLLLNEIKDSTDFIGTVLKENIDSVEFYTIKAYTSAGELTQSNKTTIVNAFTQFVNTKTFYKNYKASVDSNLAFSFMRDSFYNDIAQMVEKGLFLDSNGTLNNNLLLSEEEEIKWFNWRIFAKYFDPDPENTFKTKFQKYPACGRVFFMSFQQANAKEKLAENDIMRYFEYTNKGLFQIGIVDGNTFYKTFDTKVNDLFFITSTTWKVTPLFRSSELPFLSGEMLSKFDTPGHATIKYMGESAFKDTTWFQMNLFYSIKKTVIHDGNPLDLKGAIIISAGVFKYKLGGNQGHFTNWNSDIYLRATNVARDIDIEYVEKSFLKPESSR